MEEDEITAFDRLAVMFGLIEQMIENENRYRTYGTEIEAARQLDMTFAEWEQLADLPSAQEASSGCVFIKPSEPLKLAA
jgi:hypothetical protein